MDGGFLGDVEIECSPWSWDMEPSEMSNHSVGMKNIFTDCVGSSPPGTPAPSGRAGAEAGGDKQGVSHQESPSQTRRPGVASNPEAAALLMNRKETVNEVPLASSVAIMNGAWAGEPLRQGSEQQQQQQQQPMPLEGEQTKSCNGRRTTSTPAVKSSPQISPPKLEHLTQSLRPATELPQQPKGAASPPRQKGGQVTKESPAPGPPASLPSHPKQNSPKSFIAQLSHRLVGLQQSSMPQRQGQQVQEAEIAQAKAVLPAAIQKLSESPDEEHKDDESRGTLPSPEEPV
ncbi:unnamed protein product, partial [Sphacelaria rigidula]